MNLTDAAVQNIWMTEEKASIYMNASSIMDDNFKNYACEVNINDSHNAKY